MANVRVWCRNQKFIEEVRKHFDGEHDLQIACERGSEACRPLIFVKDKLQGDDVWDKGLLIFGPLFGKVDGSCD